MKKSARQRLDAELVTRGICTSRTEAQRWIEEERVSINGLPARKAATMVSGSDAIVSRCPQSVYVSRGAHKLLKGLEHFGLDPSGLVCVDVGASTGGFTQVLLERGASCVYAVDVGYGQLAWQIRSDTRVRVMERTNARSLSSELLGSTCQMAVCDASFISLRLLLNPISSVLFPLSSLVALIKPQFEAGRERVGKRGVVSDASVHRDVINEFMAFVVTTDMALVGLTWSPIKGPEGNIEFLAHLQKGGTPTVTPEDIEKTVTEAHELLG